MVLLALSAGAYLAVGSNWLADWLYYRCRVPRRGWQLVARLTRMGMAAMAVLGWLLGRSSAL